MTAPIHPPQPVTLPAKVLALSVRPLQASHLCFNMDGILGDAILNSKNEPVATLGAPVTAFPFDSFYSTLETAPTTHGDKSRLLYDPGQLQSYTQPYALATLRAEGRKLALQKAINARQNAYWAKYGSISKIKDQMVNSYSASKKNSKPARLTTLGQLADEQWNKLSKEYNSDKRTGVVKSTGIVSQSTDASATWDNVEFGGGFPIPPAEYLWTTLLVTNENAYNLTQQSGAGSSAITDYGYRVPSIEDQAKNERAQISLIDQQFAQFMLGLTLPNLEHSLGNELSSIDCDVARLQVSVLDTILMSPISGIVTGIYKNPGDFVRAGEPVIRVEDSSTVLLVAKLLFPDSITLGSTLTISTSVFESEPTNAIAGTVVAVRGQSDDDRWEVIAQFTNNGSESAVLPLGYHFDFDDTTATITTPP
jgi:hypothetical protein